MLAFDGRVHHLERGYWLKFEIKRAEPTPQRPHGLHYAFTLHDPEGNRLLGFDNAHGVPARRSRFSKPGVTYDHWHRTSDDEGRPYLFKTADELLADFFSEVRRVLESHGIAETVVSESKITERKRE